MRHGACGWQARGNREEMPDVPRRAVCDGTGASGILKSTREVCFGMCLMVSKTVSGKITGRENWRSRIPKLATATRSQGMSVEDSIRAFEEKRLATSQRPGNIKPYAECFWPKVQKAGPDDCWLWTGNR